MAPSFSGRRRIEITESERIFMPGNNNCTSLQEQSGLPVMCARAWLLICSGQPARQSHNQCETSRHHDDNPCLLAGRHKLASSSLSMTDLFLVLFLQEAN